MLAPLIGRPINTAVIRESWNEIVRLAASVKTHAVLPSVVLSSTCADRARPLPTSCSRTSRRSAGDT